MRLLSQLNPKSGEFIIEAPLNKCMKLIDTFPRRGRWEDHRYGYGVDDRFFIAPNKYHYKLYVWKYKDIIWRNLLAELTIELEELDEYTTRLSYVSKIPNSTSMTCVIGILFGSMFFVAVVPIVFLVMSIVILFIASNSKDEWIEIHRNQFKQIEKPA